MLFFSAPQGPLFLTLTLVIWKTKTSTFGLWGKERTRIIGGTPGEGLTGRAGIRGLPLRHPVKVQRNDECSESPLG